MLVFASSVLLIHSVCSRFWFQVQKLTLISMTWRRTLTMEVHVSLPSFSGGVIDIITWTETGQFSAEHDCVKAFWRVVESFTAREKALVLKFVTSCSRAPLLGFKASVDMETEVAKPICVSVLSRNCAQSFAFTVQGIRTVYQQQARVWTCWNFRCTEMKPFWKRGYCMPSSQMQASNSASGHQIQLNVGYCLC